MIINKVMALTKTFIQPYGDLDIDYTWSYCGLDIGGSGIYTH